MSEGQPSRVQTLANTVLRREPATSKARFEKFASIRENGELYMTEFGFVDAIAPEDEDYHKISRQQYGILFHVADRKRRGLVSFQDFVAFENLLGRPDAEYDIAFRLFDLDGKGKVSWDVFQNILNESRSSNRIPFNWNCDWATLYVGGKSRRHDMDYSQFSQMLRGLTGERVRQAFHYFDKNGTGFIDPEAFQRIIVETARHKLSDHLLDNLHTLSNVTGGSKISYANVRAFQNVVREMDMVSVIVQSCTNKSPDGKITKSDFMNEAARETRFGLFTPLEVDILFHFASLDNPSGRLDRKDFARVLDPSWQGAAELAAESARKALEMASRSVSRTKQFLNEFFISSYHFGIGAIAGAIGATLVYPIDLVKTRMQNQRSRVVGQLLYTNSIDCARKVFRNESFLGFYRGLGPQLIGVAPEKAIKLTMNDLIRGKARLADGSIPLQFEVLAGGSAGACQVIFTNPLEIVKIRLQVQGELARNANIPRRSALDIVKGLGLLGLYKGASACLLRDVPFSAIYFPTYAHLKKDYFKESPSHKLNTWELLLAGAAAGMPAAYLTTPADVIKTRLQVEARKGDTTYRNIPHAFSTILREEGFKAFFKGGPARIFRSSPQFGATLAAYEVIQRLLPFPGKQPLEETQPSADIKPSTTAPLPYLRSRNALKIILV